MDDPTEEEISYLDEGFQDVVIDFINGARERGADVFIGPLGGYRSWDEQQQLVAMGRSKAHLSAHNFGLAFDIDVFGYNRNEITKPFWDWIGRYGKSNFPLDWGGDWKSIHDPGHFEYRWWKSTEAYRAGRATLLAGLSLI
jgi:peptidoglycan L-alanyl-D-glutamate endopeptidase CwlK